MSQNSLSLPSTGFLRLSKVLQFVPYGKTRWYSGVKSGEFPRPVKHGRAALYRAEDIRALSERIGSQATEGAE